MDNLKSLLLNQLKPAVVQQLQNEITSGSLDISEPYDFESNFERIYSAIKENKVTVKAFKSFKVTREDLRVLVIEALTEVGVQL